MNRDLLTVKPVDYNMFKWYFSLRSPYTCENAVVDTFLWCKYYNTKYFYTDHGLIWVLSNKDGLFTVAPLAKKEDLKASFLEAKEYFNEELHQPLAMYLVDEEALEILSLDPEEYEIVEERQYFDYVYDGEKLRTLSGRALHKKKNHVNSFFRTYEGRYQYRTLHYEDRDEIMVFLEEWNQERGMIDPYHRLEAEFEGIRYMLYDCSNVPLSIGCIDIDGKMQACSMGSYSRLIDMAYIHVEKANPGINGLYNVINQQFILHEFPHVSKVNREDDMGLEGLRKSKLSYNPIELVKKYSVLERR